MPTELSRALICLAANSAREAVSGSALLGVPLSAGREAAPAAAFLAVAECLLEYGRFTHGQVN